MCIRDSLHNVDAMGHMFWHFAKSRQELPVDETRYQHYMEQVYVQTDRYFGEFMHYLDDGWAIMVVSDHGLTCSFEEHVPLLGDPFGVNAIMMQELGYTVLQKDEQMCIRDRCIRAYLLAGHYADHLILRPLGLAAFRRADRCV